MSENIKFCTMYIPCSNIELSKDVGQIPYMLSALFGWQCTVAGCNIDLHTANKDILNNISLMKLKYIFNKELTGVLFLLKNSRKYDLMNFYHGGRSVILWSKIYHCLNPNGKIYLKLDMDFRLCDKYDNDPHERYIFNKTLKNVDFVSTESLSIKNRIQKYTDKNIEIISDGYNINECITPFCKKENTFLTVGRLGTEQKATEILLEAFAISAPYHDWKLKLIGNIQKGFESYIYDFFIKYPELKDRVYFLGEINNKDDLNREYQKARVFVLPSLWESFGLVVCEALSFGCRIIVSDQVPPKKEFTNNEIFGRIVKAKDPVDLSNAIIDETKKSYHCIETEKIVKYADDNFDWKKICIKLHDLLIAFEREGID